MKRFDIKGAAGYVVAQLDGTPRTEQELIRLAQQRSREDLGTTRYAYDDTVECPALRRLAEESRINSDMGLPYRRRRYWLR